MPPESNLPDLPPHHTTPSPEVRHEDGSQRGGALPDPGTLPTVELSVSYDPEERYDLHGVVELGVDMSEFDTSDFDTAEFDISDFDISDLTPMPAAPTRGTHHQVNAHEGTSDSGAAAPGRPLGLVSVNEDIQDAPRGWLVEGLWLRQGVGFIGGPPKAGKSWLAVDLAISVALGIPFLDYGIPEPGLVMYFHGEEYRADVIERIDRLLAGLGRTRPELAHRLLITEATPCLEREADRQELLGAVRRFHPALVVIDPMERFLDRGDTNTTKDMRPVTNFLRKGLSRDGKAAVCTVHHTDKRRNELRGTGDFRAVSEVTLKLSEAKDGRVVLKTEMRHTRAPEPVSLVLQDLDSNRIAWTTETSRVERVGQEFRAREILRNAGSEGLSSDAFREAMKIRSANVTPLLERIGAKRESPRGPWTLDS